MSTLVKITLAAALILSIAVPFGAFAMGEKSKGRYKKALGVNAFLFFGTLMVSAVFMFSGSAAAAEPADRLGGGAWYFSLPHFPQVWPASAVVSPYPQLLPQLLAPSAKMVPSLVNH